MEKFAKLGLSRGVLDILKKSNIVEPTEIQERAIPIALKGEDIIGGSSTGSGKTLVFAAPIIENLEPYNQIQALVLTPTRELAEQVAKSIRKFSKDKKLNILPIYGGIKIDQQIRKISTADVIVGTPGRIIDHLNRRTLRFDHLKILVLDEVDRMFDMGFSKDVEKILKQCPEKRQTMMFSATISSDIDYLARKYTKNAKEISVESNVDPSKLKQTYYDVPQFKKFSLLAHLLKQEKSHLAMVFCSTRRNADFVTKNLQRIGIDAEVIHGGLVQKKRMRVLEKFHKKQANILVCTDVAARGLDINDVSHVYNYDLPKDKKDYIHRIGRTARAGKNGKAINILASRDYENFSNIMKIESIKIDKEELPRFENIMIQMDKRNDRKFGGRRDSRGSDRGRPRYGGSSRDNKHKYGYKRPDSRSRDSKPRNNNYGRDKPRYGSNSRDSRPRYGSSRQNSNPRYKNSNSRDEKPKSNSYDRSNNYRGNKFKKHSSHRGSLRKHSRNSRPKRR